MTLSKMLTAARKFYASLFFLSGYNIAITQLAISNTTTVRVGTCFAYYPFHEKYKDTRLRFRKVGAHH